MCPDSKLLSAFYDGEVGSPWKERIEEHLLSCENCRSLIKTYKEQSHILQSAPEPSYSSTFSDLEHMVRQRNTVERSTYHRFGNGLIPVAAAAAAILAFFMGFVMAGNSGPSGSYMSPAIAVSQGWSIPQGDLTVSGEDIDALLSLLEPSDSQMFNQESSIELPVDLDLGFYGDSQLTRSVSFNGGSSH
ncbi:MAG: hypothetical protein B6241_05865 [Spirochaetaceae bacterium 4572_59]|nr:MAG: hypothetical protein B6241_05865 [Spirochaetaceae bacterium 4572_59]